MDDGARSVGQALRSPAEQALADLQGAAAAAAPHAILLTDDVAANQLVTATLLRREGHHVDIAASGRAAITAIQMAPYDLVFMDIFMPGMSGQEATAIIRGLPEPAGSTPVVALTARTRSGR